MRSTEVIILYRARLSLAGCGLLRSEYVDSGVYLNPIPGTRGSAAVVAG